MPRNLQSDKATLDAMAPLSKNYTRSLPSKQQPLNKMKDVRPYSLLLNRDDVDECDWLEHVAFDPMEAASREKIAYRLALCGQLCSGIFSSAYPTTSTPLGALVRARVFPSVDSADSDRKRILLGHIIATKHSARTVTDASMNFPTDWRSNYQISPSTGHDEDGETVCLHSLCIHPDFQKQGLGRILLLSWVQRMRDSGTGKRAALICREKLVGWYEEAGFKKVGPSKCQYGGGGWVDMVIEFDQGTADDDY